MLLQVCAQLVVLAAMWTRDARSVGGSQGGDGHLGVDGVLHGGNAGALRKRAAMAKCN